LAFEISLANTYSSKKEQGIPCSFIQN